MKVDRHTILHRKDETGVIVESGVFGPDDEIPEGFGPQEFEVVQAGVRVAELAESKLTPWDEKAAKAEAGTQPEPDEVNDGTPLQARQAVGKKLTGAEQEALKALDEVEDESDDGENEVSDGSPVQAKIEAGVELTEAEEKPGEESGGSRRRSSR